MRPTMKDVQTENGILKSELEYQTGLNKVKQAEIDNLAKEAITQGNQIIEKSKRIDTLNEVASDLQRQLKFSKEQAASYKKELDSLTDTKNVLDRLMCVFQNPNNKYQEIVDELGNMLNQERSRADALDRELRNIQFNIQENRFLTGKVQAYESMLHVRHIRFECEDIGDSQRSI